MNAVQNPPRDHHLIPKWYLARFADAAKRVLLVKADGRRRLVPIKTASVVRDFYAIDGDDGSLDQALEVAWGPTEAAGARIAQQMLDGHFPPSDDDRLEFAGFLAVQVARGAAFRAKWEALAADEGVVPSRNATIETTVASLPQLCNVLLRMTWQLCRFPERVLFTGDQPVIYWRNGRSPRFFEGIGPLTSEEVRLPLDPRHMLILTWDGAAPDERVYDFDIALAHKLNAFTARWCEHEVFCHPELARHLPEYPVEPLPATGDPAEEEILARRITRYQSWQRAAAVAETSGWGDPTDGYGLANARRSTKRAAF